jgi:hypothetical protein
VNHQSNCCCIWSNIYVAWWTNNTENNNEEGMFRASNDAGQTFGPVLTLPTNGTIGNTEEGEEEGRTHRNCNSSRGFFFRTIRKNLIMYLYYRNIYPSVGSIDFSLETIRRIV